MIAEHAVDPNQDPISKYFEFEIFSINELRSILNFLPDNPSISRTYSFNFVLHS